MEHVLILCFPDSACIGLIFVVIYRLVSCLPRWWWIGVREGAQARLFATSLAPPSFIEGRTSSAIQRRTVRSDVPVSAAISAARRYSLRPLIFPTPAGQGVPSGVAQAIRPPPAAQADAPGLAARRKQPRRGTFGLLSEQLSWPPGDGCPGRWRRNGAIESIFDDARQFGCRGSGCARIRASVRRPMVLQQLPRSESEVHWLFLFWVCQAL